MHVVYHVLLCFQPDHHSFTKTKRVAVGNKNILYVLQLFIGSYLSSKSDK